MLSAKSLKGIFVQMILAAAVVAVLSCNLLADSNSYLSVTEKSATDATINFQLLGTPIISGEIPNSFNCGYGPECSITTTKEVLLGNVVYFPDCGCFPYVQYVSSVSWIEPDNPGHYNILWINPSGNLGNTSWVMFSDHPGLLMTGPSTGISPCQAVEFGPPVACPLLLDGQSYEVPLSGSNINEGTITVTFHTSGSSPTPAVRPDR